MSAEIRLSENILNWSIFQQFIHYFINFSNDKPRQNTIFVEQNVDRLVAHQLTEYDSDKGVDLPFRIFVGKAMADICYSLT